MAISDIKQIKNQIKTELRTNGKKCFLYSILQQSYMMLGALMFFYVEECYFKEQPLNGNGDPCIQLCKGIQKLNQSGYLINPMLMTNTSTTTSTPSTTTRSMHNESLETIFQQMMDNCQNEQCQEIKQFEKRCELDQAGFVSWSVFTFTVIFTVGKLRKNLMLNKREQYTLVYWGLSTIFQTYWDLFYPADFWNTRKIGEI